MRAPPRLSTTISRGGSASWCLLALCLFAIVGQAQAALARTAMTLARDGLPLRSVRPLDPGWSQVRIDTGSATLVFLLNDLSLRPEPPEQAGCAVPASETASSAPLVTARVQGDVLRWYSVGERQQERLALLLLDERRFVAWTPSGFFVAEGDGAERALGVWSELADGRRRFVPAAEFAAHYRRPDIVRQALTLADEAQVIAAANLARGLAPPPPLAKLLPPVGVVVSPEEGALLGAAPGGRAGAFEALVTVEIFASAGMAVIPTAASALAEPGAGERGLVSGGGSARPRAARGSWKEQVRVVLPPPPLDRDAAVETTLALHPPALRGRAVPLHLRWSGGWRVSLPTLYALTIGVNEYQEAAELPSLRFAEKDARDVLESLRAQEGRRYRRVLTQSLTGPQATLAELRARLAWLQRQAQERDVVMLFLAGHGIGRDEGGGQRYYFLPSDADRERLEQTALADDELFRALSRVRAQSVVLFIDTCHAGVTPAQRRLLEELQAQSGVVVYSATRANRPSLERPRWRNGAFTRALVDGLRGGADLKGSGRITASGLEHFISARVKELTAGEQEPTMLKASTDLWLAQVPAPRLHRRWWLWTAVAVVAAGTAGAIVAATYRPPPPFPSGIEVHSID